MPVRPGYWVMVIMRSLLEAAGRQRISTLKALESLALARKWLGT